MMCVPLHKKAFSAWHKEEVMTYTIKTHFGTTVRSMWCCYKPTSTKIPPTLCPLVRCSALSITCGSQKTWRRAQPHLQLLPGHGGGRLGWCVVGCLWLHAVSLVGRCQPLQKHHMRAWQGWLLGSKQNKKTLLQSDWFIYTWSGHKNLSRWEHRQFFVCDTCPFLPPSSPLLMAFVSPRHTLPASQWEEDVGRSPEWYRETLGDGRPVIIYLHGNFGTRWVESKGVEAEGPWADPNGV